MLRMIIACKIRLIVRTWLIAIATPGVIKSSPKIYKLHRRTYDPFKYL